MSKQKSNSGRENWLEIFQKLSHCYENGYTNV